MGALDNIDHIVVLMLENRSFDCLLGRLYPHSSSFNGINGTERNPLPAGPPNFVSVWTSRASKPGTMTIPSPDPGEKFTDITQQIFGGITASDRMVPPMSGFAANYVQQNEKHPHDARQVMHCFRPQQVPVITTLAKSYAVCDQWHASAPNQTWPNRFFAHCATAGGYVNNSPPRFPYLMPSIFERLNHLDNGWKVYFHDIPQSLTLARLWSNLDRFRHFAEFLRDASAGALPSYAFIEPQYLADAGIGMPNDQHPPHDVVFGEQLIAQVYNAVRNSPLWDKTLFIITYDEHGGCFDHAPPPLAPPPGGNAAHEGFAFDRYGVRVPAVLISPYIRPGTILRSAPDGVPHDGPPYPFDHTSIIATLRKRFGLGDPLTNRDKIAPDLEGVLQLDGPTNNGLGPLRVPAYTPTEKDLRDAIGQPLTDMQTGLHRLASILPDAGTDVQSYIQKLQSGIIASLDPPAVVQDAKRFISAKIASLFS